MLYQTEQVKAPQNSGQEQQRTVENVLRTLSEK